LPKLHANMESGQVMKVSRCRQERLEQKKIMKPKYIYTDQLKCNSASKYLMF